MDCTKIQNRIADYAVGLLTGRSKAEVEAHLAECPNCRAEFEEQERVMLMVSQVDPVEPPAGLWNGVYNRISAAPVHPSVWNQLKEGHYRRSARWSLGFATLALAALMLYTTGNAPIPQAGVEAQEYVQGHVTYAGQDILADQTALYSATIMAERAHEGQTL